MQTINPPKCPNLKMRNEKLYLKYHFLDRHKDDLYARVLSLLYHRIVNDPCLVRFICFLFVKIKKKTINETYQSITVN